MSKCSEFCRLWKSQILLCFNGVHIFNLGLSLTCWLSAIAECHSSLTPDQILWSVPNWLVWSDLVRWAEMLVWSGLVCWAEMLVWSGLISRARSSGLVWSVDSCVTQLFNLTISIITMTGWFCHPACWTPHGAIHEYNVSTRCFLRTYTTSGHTSLVWMSRWLFWLMNAT